MRLSAFAMLSHRSPRRLWKVRGQRPKPSPGLMKTRSLGFQLPEISIQGVLSSSVLTQNFFAECQEVMNQQSIHVNPTKSGISTAPYSARRRAVLDAAPHGLRPIGPVRPESLCRPALEDARPVPRRPHRCGDRRPGPALRVLLRRRQRRRVEDNQRRAVLAACVRHAAP